MYNPYFNEDIKMREQFEKESKIISKYDNILIKFLISFYLYFKYKFYFSQSFCDYQIYKLLYQNETIMFEKYLTKYMNSSVLDFGCGGCQFWINNANNINNSNNIHCIDLNSNILKYPQFILKNKSFRIDNSNIFDIDLKMFDTIFLIEVIMQIDNPDELLAYIWKKNPNCKIIMAHTCFNEYISYIYSPIKKYIFPYIPLIKIIKGKALTLEDTTDIITKSGGIIKTKTHIKNNRYLFVLEKSSY